MRPMIAVLVLLVPLAGCALESSDAEVLATFYPLAFASARIAGDVATVETLVPAGSEPHEWEPVPADVARLSGAKLVVKQGAGFEPWLDGLLANLGSSAPTVVDTTAGIQLAAGGPHEEEEAEGEEAHADEEGVDPHTWLDPVLFAEQTQVIEAALVAQFPDRAAALRERGAALRTELDQLHSEFESGLADCQISVVIANHDAYGYLARRYGFEVEAISGLSPEAEPSPQDLTRAIEAAREHNITIIFFEELVSPRVAEVVAEEVGAQTRVLSPIEGATGGKDYLALMRENLVNLREAMRCT